MTLCIYQAPDIRCFSDSFTSTITPPPRSCFTSNFMRHQHNNMSKPIAFIIGAGKRIGAGSAEAFKSKGYRIALASRSLKQEDSKEDNLHLGVDLSKPASVNDAFASLRKHWGEPSVVIYNGIVPSHLTNHSFSRSNTSSSGWSPFHRSRRPSRYFSFGFRKRHRHQYDQPLCRCQRGTRRL